MDRPFKIALLSLIAHMAVSAYHIVFGALTHSWWLFTIGIYYALLSAVRFGVLRTRKEAVATKFAGVMLMLLSVPLIGTVILAVMKDRGIVFHKIAMIGIAVYTFTKITLATYNLIKSRKSSSAKLITLRNVSFAEACVSIFALQRSMLVSFGEMPNASIQIFNGVLGGAVCVVVFLLGFHLVPRGGAFLVSIPHLVRQFFVRLRKRK